MMTADEAARLLERFAPGEFGHVLSSNEERAALAAVIAREGELAQLRTRMFTEAAEIGERFAAWEAFRHELAVWLGLPADAKPSGILTAVTQCGYCQGDKT